MLRDVVEARPVGGYRVYIRFDDGVAGEVDLAAVINFEGVFAPLRAPREVRPVPGRAGNRDHLLAEWSRHRPGDAV